MTGFDGANGAFLLGEAEPAHAWEQLKLGRKSMLNSNDRIITTHAGSLPRPPELVELIFAKARGEDYDAMALERFSITRGHLAIFY